MKLVLSPAGKEGAVGQAIWWLEKEKEVSELLRYCGGNIRLEIQRFRFQNLLTDFLLCDLRKSFSLSGLSYLNQKLGIMSKEIPRAKHLHILSPSC
jgi:hypothetical protein